MPFKNVEEVQHWPPKRVGERRYDFSHLDSHRVEYVIPAKGKLPERKYDVIVTYSHHVFTKEIPGMSELEVMQLMYFYNGKALRPIYDERYNLSVKLSGIIEDLLTTKCLHGVKDSFFVIDLVSPNGTEEPYEVYFDMWKQKKKLRLHVKTAFVRRKRNKEKAQVVKFATILTKTFKNEKIKRPK